MIKANYSRNFLVDKRKFGYNVIKDIFRRRGDFYELYTSRNGGDF